MYACAYKSLLYSTFDLSRSKYTTKASKDNPGFLHYAPKKFSQGDHFYPK